MDREVAIKVSAERFSDRFEREVHAVAAPNHPNICHIYDVGPNYLVMELVEGPTLADRIQQGAIQLEETLPNRRQIAEALEAAHDRGIIHRDEASQHQDQSRRHCKGARFRIGENRRADRGGGESGKLADGD